MGKFKDQSIPEENHDELTEFLSQLGEHPSLSEGDINIMQMQTAHRILTECEAELKHWMTRARDHGDPIGYSQLQVIYKILDEAMRVLE